MRPRIANAVDKLRGKSDVYLASTFSPINNSTFRESYFSLSLSLFLSHSPLFHYLYHPRCPMDESSGLTRALLRLSNGCPLFTRLRNSACFTILIRPVIGFMHVRSIDGSIEQTSAATTVVFHGMTTYRHACAQSLLSYIPFSFFIPRFSYSHSCRSRANRIE